MAVNRDDVVEKALEKYISDDHDHIQNIHSYNIDEDHNHVFLVGDENYIGSDTEEEPGVEFAMTTKFIKNLSILMTRSKNPIFVHMKTCGGDWQEGMAVYDAIKNYPYPVTILNYTHARSMSSIIFQAADTRVMMPHSTFMFHEGEFGFEGTPRLLRTEVDQEKKATEQMLKIYVDSMKKHGRMSKLPPSRIKKWLWDQMMKKEDVYLDAREAVEYGFADGVLGEDDGYDWKSLLS